MLSDATVKSVYCNESSGTISCIKQWKQLSGLWVNATSIPDDIFSYVRWYWNVSSTVYTLQFYIWQSNMAIKFCKTFWAAALFSRRRDLGSALFKTGRWLWTRMRRGLKAFLQIQYFSVWTFQKEHWQIIERFEILRPNECVHQNDSWFCIWQAVSADVYISTLRSGDTVTNDRIERCCYC